jgi:hypothetical protein
MARASSLKEFDYILEEERKLIKEKKMKLEAATVFRLRRLSIDEMAQIEQSQEVRSSRDAATKKEEVITDLNMSGIQKEYFRFGLRGWSNLLDENDKPVKFESIPTTGADAHLCPVENINQILDYKDELHMAILKGTRVSEEMAKNSE